MSNEKRRPKCVIEFSYCCDDYDCDCENCIAFEDAGCSANPEFWPNYFTTAEKVSALVAALKELGIDVDALQAELTYVKGEYAELSEILHNKPKE